MDGTRPQCCHELRRASAIGAARCHSLGAWSSRCSSASGSPWSCSWSLTGGWPGVCAPRRSRPDLPPRTSGEPAQTAGVATSAAPNVAVLTRYEIWMRRVRREQLGTGDENWKDLSGTAQFAAWRQLAEARGATADVAGYLTRSLLSEVLYAAGGVERELGLLRRALADVQHLPGEATARPAPPAVQQPIVGSYGAAPPVRDASSTASSTCLAGREPPWSAPTGGTSRAPRSEQACSRRWPRDSGRTAWRPRCGISWPRCEIPGSWRTTPCTRGPCPPMAPPGRTSCRMSSTSRRCLIRWRIPC